MRFPHLAHRSAAAHKLHSATATTRYEFDSGKSETINRLPALAYSFLEAVQTTGTVALIMPGLQVTYNFDCFFFSS
jgi:hypothetical protein